jgi:hypothetical protein
MPPSAADTKRSLGRQFGWLWAAFAGAAVAVPLGPWVEFRQKRPVMVAKGAYLKALVRPEELLIANGRFESTTWTATALGPPLGGAAISMFGPVTTVVVDAVSYLFSALGIGAIRGREPPPAPAETPRLRVGDLFEGWRHILRHRTLRPLFFNTALVNGLIMATSPLIAVLMLGHPGFKPWQYGLAFGLPCIGGLIGSRLARTLVARFGQHPVMFTAGALTACWSRPDRDQPNRPHTICVVDHQQHHHCCPDCSVGSARQPHWPAHGDRDCWYPLAGHPAPASWTFPPIAGDSPALGFCLPSEVLDVGIEVDSGTRGHAAARAV